jgi:D-alanyl-D-alanine carboxypeptidase (penicillin-binding protein 5/6)
MKEKWVISLSLVVIILFFTCLPVGATEEAEFELESEAAVLMNAQTGELLYSKNSQLELPPASITKIMTMLLVMEDLDKGHINLTDEVTTSEKAANMGGSQIWLEPGEVMTVEEMLKAVAIVSANDACLALAEYLEGTEARFVERMNDKAKELGMENTKFYNTNGLPTNEEGQETYTTPQDIAIMSRELINYPKVLEHSSTWIDHLRDGESFLRNTNKLVRFFEGADGLKTGHTSKAGFCLSATAKRDGMRFISVVMKAPSSEVRFAEARELLSYAFSIHRSVLVVDGGEEIGEVSVFKGAQDRVTAVTEDKLNIVVEKGEGENIVKQSRLNEEVVAPIEQGDKIGEVVALKDGQEIDKVDLVAKEGVEKAGFFQIIVQLFMRFLGKLLNIFN